MKAISSLVRPVRLYLLLAVLLVSPGLLRRVQAQGDPAVVGQWGAVQNWPVVSVHLHLLPTGKALFWAYSDGIHFWDPDTEQVTSAANAGRNVFCSGHSFLANGRLIVPGGHIRNNVGLASASIYDAVANAWTSVPDMNKGRWYPSSTTLSDGDVLVTSGDDKHRVNQLPQVYQVSSNTWRDLSNAELSLPLYPRTFLAPNGKVFVATSTSRYLDTSGTGAWTDVANRLVGGRDNYGSACLYDDGKVLWCGGGDPPTETCEVIDLNAPSPSWQFTGSMAQPRRQNNVTLLPDGTVLATGGSSAPGFNEPSGAVLPAELWVPATGQWTVMSSEQRYRGYHSCALLLPDGRVLSAGGDNEPNAQVFSPPYLFTGTPRPTISSAPASVGLSETFFVGTPDGASITNVNLLRPGALTHAQNWSQRINRLAFSTAAGGLDVTSPSSSSICPPGYYLLFLIDGNGVPSVGSFIQVTGGSTPCTPTKSLVDSITVTTVNVGQGNKRGRAEVVIKDDCGNAVSGANVTGTFSGGFNETHSAATNASGLAVLQTTATAKGNVQVTFCVDSVVATPAYDAGSNNETCDSN